MAFVRLLRAHIDSVIAVVLTAAYLVEVYLGDATVAGDTFIAELEVDATSATVAASAFLLSLAARTRLPLLPLGMAYVALVLSGQGPLDGVVSLLAGLALATYSVGAWAGGRAGQVGALGVGALAGLAVVRAAGGSPDPRELAGPLLLLVGGWLVGLAVRSVRADRGDERVTGAIDWEAGSGTPDSAGRDDTVRELRDIIERAMSTVILQARTAERAVDGDPSEARRALRVIEAAGTEALEEAQRLTAELLSPGGTMSPEPQPGLRDLDYLTEQVSAAGLPVEMRVEGRPLPLTPDLDAVAYRVVHVALMATLDHATSATSRVIVRYGHDELQIEVSDDGLGLDDDDAEEQTAGLVAVRDAVVALGGTLDAGPGEGRGYWVLARLPYEPAWD